MYNKMHEFTPQILLLYDTECRSQKIKMIIQQQTCVTHFTRIALCLFIQTSTLYFNYVFWGFSHGGMFL